MLVEVLVFKCGGQECMIRLLVFECRPVVRVSFYGEGDIQFGLLSRLGKSRLATLAVENRRSVPRLARALEGWL